MVMVVVTAVRVWQNVVLFVHVKNSHKPQFARVVHRYVFFIFVYYKDDNFPMEIPKNFMPSETSGASGCKEVRDVLTQHHVPCPAVPLLTWRAVVLFLCSSVSHCMPWNHERR